MTAAQNLDVTAFVEGEDMFDFSHSPFEGGGDAATRTWEAALAAAERYPLISDENREVFDSWAKGFGAGTLEGIRPWDNREATALVLQFVAGDYREHFENCNSFREMLDVEECGYLSPYRAHDGSPRWSFYMGH